MTIDIDHKPRLVRGKRQDVACATAHGRVTIPATVYGAFAVHGYLRSVGGAYSTEPGEYGVTHVATGYACAHWLTRRQATALARVLNDVPWLVALTDGEEEASPERKVDILAAYRRAGVER